MAITVSVEEAARRLHVSHATIRRRLHKGLLQGERRPVAQGFIWQVVLPNDIPEPAGAETPIQPSLQAPTQEVAAAELARVEAHNTDLRTAVETLQAQLDRAETELDARRREVRELHTLLAASSRLALPVPVEASTDDAADDVQSISTQPSTRAETPPVWWRRLLKRVSGV